MNTSQDKFDLILRGGTVYDGSGGNPLRADVGVTGDRITAIGDLSGATATEDVDVTGMAVSPGFIDVHSHDDFHVLASPDVEHNTLQGITTVVVGNCGFGVAPYDTAAARMGVLYELPPEVKPWDGYAGYLATVDQVKPSLNVAALVGHNTLRLDAMGDNQEVPPSIDQVTHMAGWVAEGMDAGAVGFSTGLVYEPGRYSTTDEIAAVATVAGGYSGVYTSHIRNEAGGLQKAIEEALVIGEMSGCSVQISHHKASGADNWGDIERSIEMIEAARDEGMNVTADQYPYVSGSTRLTAVLQNGALVNGIGGFGLVQAEDIVIATCAERPEYEGRSLASFVDEWDLVAEDAAQKIIDEGGEHVYAVVFMMDEGDVRRVMAHPSTMIGTDGIPAGSKPHPRAWGTYPRILGRYVRDEGVISLSDAIHKMSGMPADKFNLAGRGYVREGGFADLVVFDPETVIDEATYEYPKTPPIGMPHVIVNGNFVVRDGVHTHARVGRALRRGRE
ncbi:MAG: D-aminoacylase [Chloroflexi bacterium]|jgi:N-acyl-D-amino-acid deacylase|nr:D-aminoacylase [Chloroflexota bacterium]MBT4073060.1 D-aminoacylase [Chloroflexota bacterium]MBT4515915.1 D-aminoacylase [Chloroflexota bacterium]MBT5319535.1 D-aminoacylase [Chloroflexota bacterium]MBT6681735.1 D-aminoacylase [Chloroflexota bacterium]